MSELVITDVKKSARNSTTTFILNNGRSYSYSEVLNMAEAGEIMNVEVRKLDDGSKYLYYKQPNTLTANDLYNVIR